MGRIVMEDADCADCLCRVCARNECNDSFNPLSIWAECTCDCEIGRSRIIETDEDCPRYLPDIR